MAKDQDGGEGKEIIRAFRVTVMYFVLMLLLLILLVPAAMNRVRAGARA
jgi:hypothetical protein